MLNKQNILTFLSSLLCIVLLFVIIYPLKFVFFPIATTRIILGIVGIPYLLRKTVRTILLSKRYNIARCLLFIFFFAVLSVIINGTNDYMFVTFPISSVLVLSSCSLAVHLMKKMGKKVDAECISYFFVWAVNVQMIITVIFFFLPSIKDMMLGLLTEELQPTDRFGDVSYRLMGFGSMFASAGLVTSAAAVVIAYMMKRKGYKDCWFYFISYILIFVVGCAISRTTMVGYFISFLYLLSSPVKFVASSIKYTIVILLFLFILIPKMNIGNELELQFRFAFELFYNFFEEGSFETSSTNDTQEHLFVFPNNLLTWIVGDARFDGINGDVDYMGIDCGYLRYIFYFGLAGLFFIVLLHYSLYKKMTIILSSNDLPLMLFVLFLLINIKGYCMYIVYFGLYIFLPVKGINKALKITNN